MLKKELKILISIAIFFSLANFTKAAPAINETSGNFTHGQNVTILGSGFGVKSPVAPWMYDAVGNQSAYNGLADGAGIPVGLSYPWEKNQGENTADRVHISKTNLRNAHLTAQYHKGTPADNNQSNQFGMNDGTTRRVWSSTWYLTWWMKYSGENFSGNTKFLRMSNQGVDTGELISWAGQTFILFSNALSQFTINNWYGIKGNDIANSWNRNEISANGCTYAMTAGGGGQTISTCSPVIAPSPALDIIYQIGYENESLADGEAWLSSVDFGEIYMDNTPARVEICNAATKAASNHCEIQIPQTTWNDGSLQIEVNQGSFTDNSSQYLYVVDATGAVNATGRQITFGIGSLDITSPASPSGLSVM